MRVRRLLRTPFGWLGLQLVELAVLAVLARWVLRTFPGHSAGVAWGILTLAAVFVVVNYSLRRRYLR